MKALLARCLAIHDTVDRELASEAKMLRRHLELVREGVWHTTARTPLKDIHSVSESTRSIKGRHAEVDVDHELPVHGPYGHEEAAEGFYA